MLQVKQLRLEREREKAMREQELEMLQREKEAEHFKTWAEQEDNFHLHQAKLRYTILIRTYYGIYLSAKDILLQHMLALYMHPTCSISNILCSEKYNGQFNQLVLYYTINTYTCRTLREAAKFKGT